MTKALSENRDFRRFLLFSVFSGVGGGIFGIFMMWAIHAQYRNPIYTGIAGFMFGAPYVASFIVGPLVDRRSKVRTIRVASLVRFLVVALILAAHLFFEPGAWFFLLAILSYCVARVFERPARAAYMPGILAGEDLVRANARLNIVGTIAGLAVGGGLYALMRRGAGFELVYGANAAALLLAFLSSASLRGPESEAPAKGRDPAAMRAYFAELRAGFAFVSKGALRPLIVAGLFISFFSEMAYVNLPMFAQTHLGADSGYIVLSALALLGGIFGSLVSRAVEKRLELWKIIAGCLVAAGVARIVFVLIIEGGLARALLAYILSVAFGSAISIFYAALIQKLAPKNLVGRVAAIRASITSAAAAIGALAGGLAGRLLPGADMALLIKGGSYIVIGACLCLSASVRSLPKIADARGD